MKGIDIFCASQAATSICLSMEEASSSSSSSTIQLGGGSISGSRLIDRYNPIIRDSRRTGGSSSGRIGTLLPPSISPKPKNTSSNKKSTTSKPSKETKKKVQDVVKKRNSSWSCTKPGDFITPPGSTRYLLSEKDMLEYGLNENNNEAALKLVPAGSSPSSTVVVNSFRSSHEAAVKVVADNESFNPPKPAPSSLIGDQVVVLRVSLHCRGCEKKMRKHLSRMQGVTSFNIDFAAKKVTVTGDVTPLAVLASISKVKNAQLWPPTLAAPSIIPSPSLINSELKNSMTTQQQVVSHGKLEYLSRNISPASLEAIGKIVSV